MIEVLALSLGLAFQPVSDTSQCLLRSQDLERSLQLARPGATSRRLDELTLRCHSEPERSLSDLDDLRRDWRLQQQATTPPPPQPWDRPSSWEHPFD